MNLLENTVSWISLLPCTVDNSANIIGILSVAKFMEEEQPYFAYDQSYREQEIDKLTSPDAEDSTELGDVKHAQKKGSIEPSRSRRYIRGYY